MRPAVRLASFNKNCWVVGFAVSPEVNQLTRFSIGVVPVANMCAPANAVRRLGSIVGAWFFD